MSRSSTEVEYHALTSVTSEITWLKSLLKDFWVDVDSAMVYCDNQAAIHIVKHVEIDCQFTIEKVNEGLIKLVHVPSKHQLADLLTKPLPQSLFVPFMSKLGIHDAYHPI